MSKSRATCSGICELSADGGSVTVAAAFMAYLEKTVASMCQYGTGSASRPGLVLASALSGRLEARRPHRQRCLCSGRCRFAAAANSRLPLGAKPACINLMHCSIAAWSHRRAEAFTIMEVLVATLLISIAMGSIMAMNSKAIHTLRATLQTAASSQVLQQRIEMIRARPWPEFASAPAMAVLMNMPTESEKELTDA